MLDNVASSACTSTSEADKHTGRSLMYSEKIVRGAKIDPCVTPCANRSKSDNTAEMAQV